MIKVDDIEVAQQSAIRGVIRTFLLEKYKSSTTSMAPSQYEMPEARFRLELIDALVDCLPECLRVEGCKEKRCENCSQYTVYAELLGVGSACRVCKNHSKWEHILDLRNDLASLALMPLAPEQFRVTRNVPLWTPIYIGDESCGVIYWFDYEYDELDNESSNFMGGCVV